MLKRCPLWFLITLLLLLALCPLAINSRAYAATPTPTPTLRPVPATPTSSYLYFRATPTPLNIGFPPDELRLQIQGVTDVNQAADIAINAWRWVNQDHLLDLITSIMVAAVTFGLLMSIARRSTRQVDQ